MSKFDPDKFLEPIFSEKALISEKPIVVIPAIEIQRANRRIAVSIRQNEAERSDSVRAASRLYGR